VGVFVAVPNVDRQDLLLQVAGPVDVLLVVAGHSLTNGERLLERLLLNLFNQGLVFVEQSVVVDWQQVVQMGQLHWRLLLILFAH